jgi:hypothetical protein
MIYVHLSTRKLQSAPNPLEAIVLAGSAGTEAAV